MSDNKEKDDNLNSDDTTGMELTREKSSYELLSMDILFEVAEIWKKLLCLWHNDTQQAESDENFEKAHLLIKRKLCEARPDCDLGDVINTLIQIRTTYVRGESFGYAYQHHKFKENLKFLDDANKRLSELNIDNTCPFCKLNFLNYELLFSHMTNAHMELTPKPSKESASEDPPKNILTVLYTNPNPLQKSTTEIVHMQVNAAQKPPPALKKKPSEANKPCVPPVNMTKLQMNELALRELLKSLPERTARRSARSADVRSVDARIADAPSEKLAIPKPKPKRSLSKTRITLPTTSVRNRLKHYTAKEPRPTQQQMLRNAPATSKASKKSISSKYSITCTTSVDYTASTEESSTSTGKPRSKNMAYAMQQKMKTKRNDSLNKKLHSVYLNKFDDQFLRDFIKELAQHRCLWQVYSSEYRNRDMKRAAVEALADIFQQHYSERAETEIILKLVARLKRYHTQITNKRPPKKRLHIWRHLDFLKNAQMVGQVNVEQKWESNDEDSDNEIEQRLRELEQNQREMFAEQRRQRLQQMEDTHYDTDLEDFHMPSAHHGTYCFSCQKCKKSFKREHNLNVHMSRTHPTTRCESCCIEFKNTSVLKRHLILCHRYAKACPLGKCNVDNWKAEDHLLKHFAASKKHNK